MKYNVVDAGVFEFWGVEDKGHMEQLDFLIQDKADMKVFMDEFYTGDILKSMMAYKKFKKENNGLTKESFGNMFENGNKKSILGRLFQESISDTHIEYMDRYNISHHEIYRKSQELPHESLMNIIKGNYTTSTVSTYGFLIES